MLEAGTAVSDSRLDSDDLRDAAVLGVVGSCPTVEIHEETPFCEGMAGKSVTMQ